MKKLLSSLFLMCSFSVFAQNPTTDYISIFQDTGENGGDPIELNGESEYCYLTARLEGTQFYTAYQMDIHFPEGMNVTSIVIANDEYTSDGNIIYAFHEEGSGRNKKTVWEHSLLYNMIGENTYRVICKSDNSANFTLSTGDLFYINITASAFMKPGDVNVYIDNVILTRNEDTKGDGVMHGVSYVPSAPCGGTITGVSGECSNVPLTISSAGWSTCILPFDAAIPDGVEAFTCDAYDESNLLLVKASSFEAYTPYILKATNGSFSGEVSGTVDGDNYPESGVVNKGYINGAIVPQQVSSGFVLQKLQSEGVKFYPMNGQVFSIPAGKCWVTLPAEAGVKGFCMVQGESTDAIESVNGSVPSSACYTLDGKLVETPRIGQIYVRDGKKLLKVK